MASFPQERGVFRFARLCAYAMFDRRGLLGRNPSQRDCGLREGAAAAVDVRCQTRLRGLDDGAYLNTLNPGASMPAGLVSRNVSLNFVLLHTRRWYDGV